MKIIDKKIIHVVGLMAGLAGMYLMGYGQAEVNAGHSIPFNKKKG